MGSSGRRNTVLNLKGVEMGRRGRKRVIEREQAYWQLLSEGMGTAEACRQLGIGRKTGYRWRAENGGLPPAHRVTKLDSGRYLSLFEEGCNTHSGAKDEHPCHLFWTHIRWSHLHVR